MTETKWTAAQSSAIAHRHGALLVSAAAGSGKTAVLVQRAVNMICREEDPVPADRLLILTFTNAAAAQLRSRIAARLEEEVQKRPDDTGLKRQRLLLRRAFVGTLDAFCQQLVKDNFSGLDIPPDVAVGEAALLQQLADEALAETMEEMYADESFAQFAALYGRSRSDQTAQDAILRLYAFTRPLPNPNAHIDAFVQMYRQDASFADTVWGGTLLAFAQETAQQGCRLLVSALQVVDEDETLAPYRAALAADLAAFEQIKTLLQQGSWNHAVAAVRAWAPARLGAVRGGTDEQKERVKLLRKSAADMLARLQKYCLVCTTEEFADDRAQALPLVSGLCRATQLYAQKYEQAKLEQKVLDFADFEQYALRLLRDENGNRSEVAVQTARRYDVVMVDEYQDTNELQSTIYEVLANEEGSNLFYVGDVKQSIYRFRLANPDIFLHKKENWAPYEVGTSPSVLMLGHNFRSGQGVVEGVNYLFSVLMSTRLGELEYTEEERLIQGSAGGDPEGLELCLVEDPEGEGDAGFVAEKIQQMLQDGYRVREGETTRPCKPGDFCILLRAKKNMMAYVAALEARGVPVATNEAEDLLQSPEVLPLTAALAAIDNPGDDVSLAAMLMGPMFRFTADEMLQLRAVAPQGNLWGALVAGNSNRCTHFVNEMAFYRTLAAQMPVGHLCEEILVRTGYLSAVGAMEGGPTRRDTLLRFVGWVNTVSERGRGALPDLVRVLQTGRGPESGNATPVDGRVNLLTIHKSKGLEFPICILADAGHKFNLMDAAQRVQMHRDLGVGLYLRAGNTLFPTLPLLAIRQKTGQEALSEEMRVLYVALTRAKDRMIVTAAQKDPVRYLQQKGAQLAGALPSPAALSGQNSFADWITMAALCHPNATALQKELGGMLLPVAPAIGTFVMGVYPQPQTARQEEQGQFALTAKPDEALEKKLMDVFVQKPARQELAEVPLKVSVTQLVKQEGEAIWRRPAFMYKEGLTAAEKGTAQHAFMQYANFVAAKANLEEEIARLVGAGHLAAEVAGALSREDTELFLSSKLFERMTEAQKLLREVDFITALPASEIRPGLSSRFAQESVLVQGIADAVLINGEEAEIVDYKTDKGKTAGQLAQQYTGQLQLYCMALQKRLNVKVQKMTIWAFALGCEVDIPL